MDVIASIQANLQQALQKKKPREQTVKFEFDGQVRACCLPKPFTYADLLKSIQQLFGNRADASIETIQCSLSQDHFLCYPVHNDEDLKQIFVIMQSSGTNKLNFILKKKSSISPDSSPPPGTILRQKRYRTDQTETSKDGGYFTPESKEDYPSSGYASLASQDSTNLGGRASTRFSSNASSVSSNSLSSQTSSSKSFELNFNGTSTTQTPSNWKLGRQLGQGAFGKVYLCYDVDTGGELAVKQIPLQSLNSQTPREMKIFECELNIYKELNHERIVRFFGAQRTNNHLQIFMEYMTGGSVREQILNYGPLSESVTRKYTRQILEGLIYLHENRFVHRDIKCANILRDISGNIKLGDFGTSKRLMTITSQNQPDSGTIGTAHWTAPEIIQGSVFGRRADIWSLGCTIVEMLTTGPPWQHLEPIAAIFHIATCVKAEYQLPEHVSNSVKQLIDLCLTKDYHQRPNATDLLQHEFLQDICSHR